MSAYWVQFAKTGNPNKEGLAEWPAYDSSKDQYIEFGEVVKVGQGCVKKNWTCGIILSLNVVRTVKLDFVGFRQKVSVNCQTMIIARAGSFLSISGWPCLFCAFLPVIVDSQLISPL